MSSSEEEDELSDLLGPLHSRDPRVYDFNKQDDYYISSKQLTIPHDCVSRSGKCWTNNVIRINVTMAFISL